MTLDYQTPPTLSSRTRRLALAFDVFVMLMLGVCVLALLEAPTILEAAGGMVGYYLLACIVAAIPLALSRRRTIKVMAFLFLLAFLKFAYQDHVDGLARQERVLRVLYTAEARQAAASTTQPSGGSLP